MTRAALIALLTCGALGCSSSEQKGDAGMTGAAGTTGAAGMTGAAGTTGSGGNRDAGATGGAGSGGGHSDAGAGEVGGVSACAPGKYLVCESFESTGAGAIPMGWTRQGDAALAGVDDKQAARGTHALKLGAVANGPRRIVYPATTFGSAHWGRIDTVQDPNGKHQWLYNVQPNGPEFGTGSSYNYKYDSAWHCAEWHIDASDPSYHFWFDGIEVTQIAKMNGAGKLAGTGIPMVFKSIEVGWYNYQSAPPGFVAWIDEVAIAATRIGCAIDAPLRLRNRITVAQPKMGNVDAQHVNSRQFFVVRPLQLRALNLPWRSVEQPGLLAGRASPG